MAASELHSSAPAIEVEHLTKVYPPSIRAVDDVSFSVDQGEVFGMLGPNGAGKTTTIKMITTLSPPTSGLVKVFGVDARTHPEAVRSTLGYVPQSVSVDSDLSAYENLLVFSKLFFVGSKDRSERIRSSLAYMGLADRADDLVKTYSGGMMRRLEIAQTLVNRPRILFLDEPSIGLDPASRLSVHESIKRLKHDYDTTIFITTHDMGEADDLCDRIAIMDAGRVAALGSPDDLKKSVGGDVVTIKLARGEELPAIPKQMALVSNRNGSTVELLAENGDEAAPQIISFLDSKGIATESVSISRPGLDDVFLKYTKKHLEDSEDAARANQSRRSFMRHAN